MKEFDRAINMIVVVGGFAALGYLVDGWWGVFFFVCVMMAGYSRS